ncbi:MAG: hypothetical protein PHR96_00505 [Clostridia bacterium]|nr:hypothetical protein [Clostridia bacterium]
MQQKVELKLAGRSGFWAEPKNRQPFRLQSVALATDTSAGD